MRVWRVGGVAILGAALAGCALLSTPFCAPNCNASRHSSSSLVDFLYPSGELPPREDSIPELHVPLRVGLTFLPAHGDAGPDAALREELLERIRQRFSERKFVAEIVLIPDYYLSGQHGFEGLQGVQRLYAVDLMALVSYDQVSHTDQNGWSLGYLTIVGAYLIKGDRYDIATLLDLAVVDPASRSLVLRAGGVDRRRGNIPLMSEPRRSREAADAGFSGAADQMIEHFDTALSGFETAVRAGRANVRIVHKGAAGAAGGGGAITWPWLVALAALVAGRTWRRRLPAAP
jgi:rhombotail lipoprotein